MNLDDKIFEALESCRYVCETYDGHPEPESLKTFRDSYNYHRKKGVDKDNAIKIAAGWGLYTRGAERGGHYIDEVFKKYNVNKNYDDIKKMPPEKRKKFEKEWDEAIEKSEN